jgi:uncharacterized membrane protein
MKLHVKTGKQRLHQYILELNKKIKLKSVQNKKYIAHLITLMHENCLTESFWYSCTNIALFFIVFIYYLKYYILYTTVTIQSEYSIAYLDIG